MVKVTNIFGDEYSGAVGQSGVFAKWKGIQYRRKYAIPANPKTTKQVSVRTDFANAIAEWHALNNLQQASYGYLAAGQGMSGFNLLVRRWQKTYGTTRTVRPSYGMKIVGSALTFMDEAVVGAVAEVSPLPAFAAGTHIISLDDATPTASVAGAVTNGAVATGAKAFVDLLMGQVRIITAPAAGVPYWISYKYGGNQILAEKVTVVDQETTTRHTKYFPIDYGTVVFHAKATAPTGLADSAVQAAEVDIVNGKLKSTAGSFAATSTVDYTKVAFLADTKLEVQKANSSFVAFRGYTDAKGRVQLGLTAQDQNYDTDLTKTGYTAISRIAQAAAAAAKNETIIMTAA